MTLLWQNREKCLAFEFRLCVGRYDLKDSTTCVILIPPAVDACCQIIHAYLSPRDYDSTDSNDTRGEVAENLDDTIRYEMLF